MKKIALCISGDFRFSETSITILQQLRHISGFVSACDCDIYLHSWNSKHDELIKNYLKPKKFLFEEHADFSALVTKIKFSEKNLKPNRDNGSLSMFFAMEKVFSLIENINDYDFVIRMRPDIYCERSLYEILDDIKSESERKIVYIPDRFFSQGINDQFAIGSVEAMKYYFSTYKYAVENIETAYFNPESILLENLLSNNIKIKLISFPYALMREVPYTIDSIYSIFHDQDKFWWAKKYDIPLLTDMTNFFEDKSRANISYAKGILPQKFFIEKDNFVLQIEFFDKNPNVQISLYDIAENIVSRKSFLVNDGHICVSDTETEKFVFPFVNQDLYISCYYCSGNLLKYNELIFPLEKIHSGDFLQEAISKGYQTDYLEKQSSFLQDFYKRHKSNRYVQFLRKFYKFIFGR